ncbi:hypothetical protein EHV15_34260 [Paenibacillus oralis]|uniref:Uncharacterized protein n=1 Tax=Paenibacillus oralis TaxID=2490856 RepID=A0A3P3TE00_9BACL|nr:hypothetical protein [Paenibacillus oralis]RRJ54663.1 hypothetical protein EHV15_34260 [Paenibacillus oralis]
MASTRGDVEVCLLVFENFEETPNMGDKDSRLINCPHCDRNGSVYEWNATTIHAKTDSDSSGGVTRIHEAEPEDEFHCPYCFEVSTFVDLKIFKE